MYSGLDLSYFNLRLVYPMFININGEHNIQNIKTNIQNVFTDILAIQETTGFTIQIH